jgi:hypothetical protein
MNQAKTRDQTPSRAEGLIQKRRKRAGRAAWAASDFTTALARKDIEVPHLSSPGTAIPRPGSASSF